MDDHDFRTQVRDLAKSPLLDRLFSILEERYVQNWKNAQSAEKREEAHQMLKAAENLKFEITYLAEDERIKSFNRRS